MGGGRGRHGYVQRLWKCPSTGWAHRGCQRALPGQPVVSSKPSLGRGPTRRAVLGADDLLPRSRGGVGAFPARLSLSELTARGYWTIGKDRSAIEADRSWVRGCRQQSNLLELMTKHITTWSPSLGPCTSSSIQSSHCFIIGTSGPHDPSE